MKLYVIRHGETFWNAEKRFQGCADIELNNKGILLAERTGAALRDVPFHICYTSPLKRAKKTAELVLNRGEVPVVEDTRIQEISFGKMEGLTAKDIEPLFLEQFFNDPSSYEAPEGGESLEKVCERTRSFYQDLIQRADLAEKTILVSTHGCAMRALLQNIYEDASLENFWRGSVPPNCGICMAEIKDGKAELRMEDVVMA